MVIKKNLLEKIFQGTCISSGLAAGKAFIYTDILLRDHELYTIRPEELPEEYKRVEQAIDNVRKELTLSAERVKKELNAQIAGIFLAQVEMLRDPELAREIKWELKSCLVNAEQIVKRVFRKWELRFRQIQDERISYRADDIIDLNRRMIRALTGISAHMLENLPNNSIIVAKRLLPSDTVFLSRKFAKGIVTEYGGTASHTALLTRELGIPSIGRISGILDSVSQNDVLLVNGDTGNLVVNPSDESRKTFAKELHRKSSYAIRARKECCKPAIFQDGRRVMVMANVSCRDDVEVAVRNGADGIGLFRIENIYLSRKHPPTMEELTKELENALAPASGKPITVRMLDIGGDKRLTYLNGTGIDDSFLGRRGIRFLLEYPELLYTQFNALLRLSESFDIKILIPMVTFAQEMQLVREMFQELLQMSKKYRDVPLGAMIETPASALCAEEFHPFVDFYSIGTNDLTQYTMAAGRENSTVGNYFVDDHPAIFKLIDLICRESLDKPVSLCGELASNKSALRKVLDSDIETLSVAPPFIPEIKQFIREQALSYTSQLISVNSVTSNGL
ncbi:MAG: phosphoenolpyruvate--protein phosphotransferase [Fibrobacter sp.]|nr:phosphoenolpyruvate--protein phosphotransferase [Fibrobacter sp.]